jgi:hypothetical protein
MVKKKKKKSKEPKNTILKFRNYFQSSFKSFIGEKKITFFKKPFALK